MDEFSIERLEAFAQEAHQVAVDHGWWDGDDRDNRELMALIHSEISEALEEYRSKRGMIWYAENGKPEGIAIELIDAVIRICDFMKHRGIPFKKAENRDLEAKSDLPVLAGFLHSLVGSLMWEDNLSWEDGRILNKKPVSRHLSEVCYIIYCWLDIRGFDIWQLLEIKHNYNKTRPYRHGNKVC